MTLEPTTYLTETLGYIERYALRSNAANCFCRTVPI